MDVSGVKTTKTTTTTTEDGGGDGRGKRVLRWVHDAGGLHGGTVNAERRFRLKSVAGGGEGEEKEECVGEVCGC